ncbi:KIF6 [Symbiodinium sp. CCMP2456]|nr:KIF6 [Symbiodinium sp. CCMP2456]
MASNIKVFIRVRPGRPAPGFKVDEERKTLVFEHEKTSPDYDVNNQKAAHSFQFDGVLGMQIKQQDVLDVIAKPVIEDVLQGVNGTIFAYGQTGSGKTFTITGGASNYEDRGLIPRTIRLMFEAFRKGPAQYRMYISYLEIYQDSGYDLLRDDSVRRLEDLPKVALREDEDGNMHLRNLSVNLAASEEDALNLLFLGDTNRVVAETPMNDASTRSHCLFIIWVDSTQAGSDVVRRSKLHLVDLAGSERVSQTGVDGKLLQEAKAINLSLHYLERVIVALHSRSKGVQAHVPYRDSMMTSVLRDSLGGNCRTTMVGCIAAEASNIPESISTCRFAQRVAQITNNARVNEELDPNLLISRLKKEVAELKEEVKVARSSKDGEDSEALTADALDQCRALVQQYVSKGVKSEEPFMCGSIERLRASFRILRDMCLEGEGQQAQGPDADTGHVAALESEIKKLKLEVAQRDQEIAVMVKMLTKQRGETSRPFIAASPPAATPAAGALSPQKESASSRPEDGAQPGSGSASAPPAVEPVKQAQQDRTDKRRLPQATVPPPSEAAELLLDKQKALEVFWQKVYRPPEAFQENKALLKARIEQAQALGKEAVQLKAEIDSVKTRLLRLRTERAMTAAGYDDSAPVPDGPEELAEVAKIERLMCQYGEKKGELRRVKSDVEGIQRLLEQNQVKVRREFETWFAGLRSRANLSKMDEDTKKELFDKVSGNSGATTPVSKEATGKVSPASATSASKVMLTMAPSGMPSSAPRTEEELAALYRAVGVHTRTTHPFYRETEGNPLAPSQVGLVSGSTPRVLHRDNGEPQASLIRADIPGAVPQRYKGHVPINIYDTHTVTPFSPYTGLVCSDIEGAQTGTRKSGTT